MDFLDPAPYQPKPLLPYDNQTAVVRNSPEDVVDKHLNDQNALSLVHGNSGARVRYGILVAATSNSSPVNYVPLQLQNKKRDEYAQLDWYGKVYLQWTTPSGTIEEVKFSGPEKPSLIPYEKGGKTPPGYSFGYYVYVGKVEEGSIPEQEVVGEVFWYNTLEDGSSSSSSSDSSDSSGDSSGDSSAGSSDGSRDSSGDSSAGSDAPSDGSTGSPSENPPSVSDSGSDKSTAIVPAEWSPTGYAALFIAEMPEVRFDDVMEIKAVARTTVTQVDHRYWTVCHPETIRVCSACPDQACLVGATVATNGTIVVTTNKPGVNVVVRLTGIRKGFRGMRFPTRTQAQFIANEEFINSAYPSE